MGEKQQETATAPVLRFKGFTEPWRQRKLGDTAEIVRGASPRPIQNPKWFDDKSDIGWLRIADVTEQNGRIHYLKQHLSTLGQEKTRVLLTPHLLLSIAATVGEPLINYIKTGVHDGFLIFLTPTFNINFMYYWLIYFKPFWKRYGQPGSQINLNSDLVKAKIVSLPDLDEQKKIGEFFNHIDHLITFHQHKCEKLQEIKKGLLQKMFPAEGSDVPEIRFTGFTDTWEQRKLIEVAKYRNGKAHEKEIDEEGKYIVVNSKFISSNGQIKKYCGSLIAPLLKSEIAFVLSDVPNGRALAKTFLVDKDNTYSLNQRIAGVTPIKNIDSIFLSLTMNRNEYFLRFDSRVGQTNLDKESVENFKANYPSYKEQQCIGQLFFHLDNLITLHQCQSYTSKKIHF